MINKELDFERFVLSVIRQKCAVQGKPFFSEFKDTNILKYINPKNEFRNAITHGIRMFDGFAPEGFDDFKMPVIIEVKYNARNMKFYPLLDSKKYISLFIVNGYLKEGSRSNNNGFAEENIVVWDQNTIATWAKEYSIDYYSFYNEKFDKIEKNASLNEVLNFDIKIKNNKLLLQELVQKRMISLSLGAGVSLDYGSKGWDVLISDFFKEIESDGVIDNSISVQKKIGGTSIINGQFTQENLKDFIKSLYKGLYDKYTPPVSNYPDSTLKYVAKLVVKLHNEKKFNIITYNYDNFLEQELDACGVKHNIMFNESMLSNNELSIYHTHGYLPFNILPKDYCQYKDYIVFSESEYHKLYNNPYHWSVVLQNYLYRDSTYLFVGCSLTDPNLRRILETTQIKGKTHIALMLTDGLSTKDQFIVHRHFMRIGVECIWFPTVIDLKHFLDYLAI